MSEPTSRPWDIYIEPVVDKPSAMHMLCAMVEGTPHFRPHVVMVTAAAAGGLATAVTGCGKHSEANAELIVRAVNAHDDLVAALDAMLTQGDHWAVEQARAALALARGEEL